MKTILVPFQDDDVAETALENAHLIGRRFSSYIEGLFVLPQPQIIAGEGIALPGVYLTQMAEDGRKLAAEARERFTRFMNDHQVAFRDISEVGDEPSAGWREVEGLESQVVGDYGRLFDLIVIGRTAKYYAGDWNIICEAALFESGRPVLVGGTGPPSALGENMVIAWNGSTETARTIALAMPLLGQAREVTVLTVEGVTVPGPSGEDVAKHLARNGIPARAVTAEPKGRGDGEAILEEAQALGADLLVKGAYTHTRLRQMIFGGATRHILSNAQMPVLMAH